jgi:hypothetical protein
MEAASAVVVGGASIKSGKKMKCAKGDECSVSAFAKCDFCGEYSQSGQHKHLKFPSEQVKYFKLNETAEDFVVCSSLCGARMCTFLSRCDVTHGLPHMIRNAYKPSVLAGSKGEYECFRCGNLDLAGNMVRADLHWGCLAREQELFFCKSKNCLLSYCGEQRKEEPFWAMEWRIQTVLRGTGARKCSEKCQIAEIFRCDFCGRLSSLHKHIKNLESMGIELSEPVEEFYVCDNLCGERMTRALVMCDLSFGMPYRIKSAYNPVIFRSKVDTGRCISCDKFFPREHLEPADPTSERDVLYFCMSKYCFFNHISSMKDYHAACGEGKSRADWKVKWHVRPMSGEIEEIGWVYVRRETQ